MAPNVKPSISFKQAPLGVEPDRIAGFGAINRTIRYMWKTRGMDRRA
jgi:hypothetical protein